LEEWVLLSNGVNLASSNLCLAFDVVYGDVLWICKFAYWKRILEISNAGDGSSMFLERWRCHVHFHECKFDIWSAKIQFEIGVHASRHFCMKIITSVEICLQRCYFENVKLEIAFLKREYFLVIVFWFPCLKSAFVKFHLALCNCVITPTSPLIEVWTSYKFAIGNANPLPQTTILVSATGCFFTNVQ
jgi:hypothetical protein